jgi:putative DNA primase/helicase
MTREQCFFMAHGIGANGKSTLFNTVAPMLGDYARRARIESWPSAGSSRTPWMLSGVQQRTYLRSAS